MGTADRSGLVERLRALATSGESRRGWVIDANDGVIATAGILEGFAGAGGSESTLVIAATTATIAGALGIGGAQWAESAGDRETQLRLVAEESAQLAAHPEDEVAELASYWEAKGLSSDVARQVAEQLSARDALAAQLESEHGIDQVMPRWEPLWAGATTAVAFVLGAAIPLLITIFVPVRVETWAILGAVVAALVLTSIVAARAAHLSAPRTIARSLTVGIGTIVVSYLAGLVLF